MSGRRHKPGGEAPPASPGPPAVAPELTVFLRGEELLERAHAVGSRIDKRVRQVVGPGALGRDDWPQPASGVAASLATALVGRLLNER